MTPLVHLICGATGAGKTTLALRLEQELEAVRFTLDDWMDTLFWMDLPSAAGPDWALARVARCTSQIWPLVRTLAARRVPSILDFGFLRRQDRAAIAALASRDGLAVTLHVLDLPAAKRWARVEARNLAGGPTFRFPILRAQFDAGDELWEPPDAAEMATLNGVFESQNSASGAP